MDAHKDISRVQVLLGLGMLEHSDVIVFRKTEAHQLSYRFLSRFSGSPQGSVMGDGLPQHSRLLSRNG